MTGSRPPAPVAAAAATPGVPAAEDAAELFEYAPCGYLSTLPDGRIIAANQALARWSGHDRGKLLGLRFHDLLTVPGRIFYETHLVPLLRMQGHADELAFDLRRADGGTLPVLLNGVQVRGDDGEPRLHRIILFKASDRREYERELLRATRRAEAAAQAKSDLLSMISHDLRTPLTSMSIAMQMLEDATLAPAQRKYLRILKSSVDGMLILTKQVLDASRIEAGQLALEERGFDLRALVHGLLADLSTQADDKAIALRSDVDPALPARLLGDPVKLGQILSNLVYNAIKFTEAGSVTLTIAPRDRADGALTLRFEVVDTGIGIDADKLGSILEDFTQADYDIGLRFGGAGLGLGICRRLLQLHDSTLQVDSVPGRGTTFGFDLALRECPPAPAAPS